MKYINQSTLDTLTAQAFQSTKPFPHEGLTGALTEQGFSSLRATYPPLDIFRKTIGQTRAFGQKAHDRYELRLEERPAVSKEWQEFIAELNGPEYRAFVARTFGVKKFTIRFQWQVAFTGCSVSPHTDGVRKIGSHLFYFNLPTEWQAEWGGSLEVLDDEGKLDYQSAPTFEQFSNAKKFSIIGNQSLLFARNDHSWHGVRELKCPEGAYRRLFTVVIDKPESWKTQVKKFLRLA